MSISLGHSSLQALLHKKLEDLVQLEHGIVSNAHTSFIFLIVPSSSQEVVVLSTVPRPNRTLPATSAGVGLHSENTVSAAQIILQWLDQRLGIGHVTSQTTPPGSVSSWPTHSSTDASITEKFWSLSPHLLANISAQSVTFFCMYFKFLASKVNQLQDEVVRHFEDSTQQLQHTYWDKLEKETLPHFRGLLTADSNVRDITVALVSSQIEETAAKLSLTSTTVFTSESTAVRYPVNLWRRVLGK